MAGMEASTITSAWDAEVGDSFVAIHHGDVWAVFVNFLDIRFDGGFFVGGEGLDFRHEIAEAVVEVDAERGERFLVFSDHVFEEDFDGVAEDDGVADLHHGGFHVEGK